MSQGMEYRQKVIAEYKESVVPLLKYYAWFEQNEGKMVSSTYQGDGTGDRTLNFPIYDATLMSFVKDATNSNLMERNYQYIYTRNRLNSHEDERRIIQSAGWQDWNILKGILSRYVLGGRTKGTLWTEAVQESIFYLILKQMKEIIEFWDKPLKM